MAGDENGQKGRGCKMRAGPLSFQQGEHMVRGKFKQQSQAYKRNCNEPEGHSIIQTFLEHPLC